MTKKQFEAFFKKEIKPLIISDYPLLRMQWNDTIDTFIKNGTLSEKAGNWRHPKYLYKKGYKR